jgi:serine phosphatase RsbU (regulator of sigma subunit)
MHGLRSYVIRDENGDYMFLLQTTLHSTLEAVRAERERLISDRLREEVESVRKLQESIMPQTLPSPPAYRICGRYESSQIRVLGGQPVVMAGGDYYDVFRINDNDTVVLLGDASGHGMKACMSIMTMHTLVRMIHDKIYSDTATFVKNINGKLYEQTVVNEDGGFITLLYGNLNSDTHQFQWTSAGHPLPILQNLETNEVEVMGGIDDSGMPLGILPEYDYEWKTTVIPPHSRLMIYTDGLQEAFPDGIIEHGEFGIEGILESLRNSRNLPLDDALQALFDDSHAFTNGTGRHDDTSVVLIERA